MQHPPTKTEKSLFTWGTYRWIRIIGIIAAVNFAWFLVEATVLGSVPPGYMQDGMCSVGYKARYTEVPCLYWEWNRIHTLSAIAGFFLAWASFVVGGLYYYWVDKTIGNQD
jgi:hypothetical protein